MFSSVPPRLSWFPRWSATRWLLFTMAAVVAYLSIMVVFRHQNFQTAQYDLGNMDQVLWQTTHGRWFQMVDPISGLLVSRTATHADYLLLLYVPFYYLWSDPQILIVLQVLFVVSGAWPLFLFGRKHLSARAAGALSVAYLLYPSVWWAVMFDLHAVVLATPLFLWAGWAAAERRWVVYWPLVLGLLLAKEQVGVTVAMMGLYLVWKQRPRWIGVLTAVLGLSWSALMLGYAIPQARDIPGHFALGYYSQYGNTVGEVTRYILTKPWTILADVFSRNGIGYQIILLMPLAFLSLAGLPLLLVALPELLVNLLSNNPNLQSIYYQYTSVLTPFVFLSAALGLAFIQKKLQPRSRLHAWAMATIVVACLLSIYRWLPFPGMRYDSDGRRPFQTSPYRADVARVKKIIGPTDRVVTTNNLAPHFTQREYEWAFPQHLQRAEAAVILTGGTYEVVPTAEIQLQVDRLKADPAWKLVIEHDQFYFFRRRE